MTATIRPGTAFVDDRGEIAQLHGIGIQRFDGRWYAWGEDKSAADTFTAIACYTSTDLANWTFVADALVAGEGDLAPERIVERPKVLRRPDGIYVMFLHLDDAAYADARVGYAVADAPAGPYRYLGGERPLGNQSRDIGVYQDEEGAYLLSEDRENGLHIYRLREDYLGVVAIEATLRQDARPEIGYESPALVREDGLFYLFGSDLTGWSLNDNKYATAPRLTGPWSAWKDFAPPGERTFDSQVSVVLPVEGGHVYIGDRWMREDLAASAAVWLPIRIGEGCAEMHWRDEWALEEITR